MNNNPSPVVGIACDRRMVGDHAFHMVGEKYIAAVRDGVAAVPFLIPVLDPPIAAADLLANLDGLLARYRIGDAIMLHAFRRDELMTFAVKLAADDAPQMALTAEAKPVAASRMRAAWLQK